MATRQRRGKVKSKGAITPRRTRPLNERRALIGGYGKKHGQWWELAWLIVGGIAVVEFALLSNLPTPSLKLLSVPISLLTAGSVIWFLVGWEGIRDLTKIVSPSPAAISFGRIAIMLLVIVSGATIFAAVTFARKAPVPLPDLPIPASVLATLPRQWVSRAPAIPDRILVGLPVRLWPDYATGIATTHVCALQGCNVYRLDLTQYFQYNAVKGQVYVLDDTTYCVRAPASAAITILSCGYHHPSRDHEYAFVTYTAKDTTHLSRRPHQPVRYMLVDYYSDGRVATSAGVVPHQ